MENLRQAFGEEGFLMASDLEDKEDKMEESFDRLGVLVGEEVRDELVRCLSTALLNIYFDDLSEADSRSHTQNSIMAAGIVMVRSSDVGYDENVWREFMEFAKIKGKVTELLNLRRVE